MGKQAKEDKFQHRKKQDKINLEHKAMCKEHLQVTFEAVRLCVRSPLPQLIQQLSDTTPAYIKARFNRMGVRVFGNDELATSFIAAS